MTWIDSIAPSAPTAPIYEAQSDGRVRLVWEASKDNQDLPVVYHLYASSTYPVDTNDAQNLHTTYLKGTETTVKEGYYYAVTSSDRYGNESAPLALNEPSDTCLPILNKGNTLVIPFIQNATSICICTPAGEEIMQIPPKTQADIHSLKSGIYFVYIIDASYNRTLVGTILKH
jgi:hypothetical protein